ncbi:hypothetical protein SNE40_004059 [Patella caerulea]|uniref:Uncharacterized protein n=2 Tax=Patella caerulea TaxID=87958 RepID=A0AAN8K973_PATCE
MECDSAHSIIESVLQKKDVYCPTDFYQILGMARRKNLFKVEILSTKDILDFKLLSKVVMRNRSRDSVGNPVQWMKLKWMRYSKETPDVIQFKYDYDDAFSHPRVTQATRGRPQVPWSNEIDSVYQEPPALSKAKYDDLQYLCNSLAIPPAYHPFYQSLRYDGQMIDRLAEPDILDATDVSTDENN